MKRWIAWIMTLVLAAVLAFACAEQPGPFFAQFEGMEWSFSSGAGGWSTDMRILPDGSFSGEFHDSEMGDTGDGYPDGTVYTCSFTGRLSFLEQVDENSWKIRVDELKLGEVPDDEWIDDGIRFIASEAYGISEEDEMILYRPGTPVNVLTEDMQMWAHLMDSEDTLYELEYWFLWSEQNESGFVGYFFDVTE